MNKSDLYDEVAYELVVTKKEARKAVDLVFKMIADALIAGDEVRIKDLCTLKVVDKAPRSYRVGRTGELVTKEAGKRVRVRMSETVMKEIDPSFTPHNKKSGAAEDDEFDEEE